MTNTEMLTLWCLGKGIEPNSFIKEPIVKRYLHEKDGVAVLQKMRHLAKGLTAADFPDEILFNKPKNQLEVITIVQGNPLLFKD